MALGFLYSIIKAALVTEKSNRDIALGKYSFKVAKEANKIEIAKAIETIYKVKVKKVSTEIVKGKAKKIRWDQPGKTSSWKKAVVTLKKGYQIEIS
ncbi:MAG: 50S ribosomal protein L23 [Candidatus Omnitrophica bacterium]|jgi:large subunit ribosomal protein L23|nr:50S ribosomal protein L23 [Candidatus Omnitrophota bacterium]MCF7891851.1 50S ribosomal protein L23 [Candidatus Omnitrophota bacterium]MCF7895650.1 50S ribosomal protein L23 [Candidatus Omnitrophota bacterium]MCF7897670.1 50S ribosomal protein L23 [Candidatus Omnitrophota bacterium]MCF7909458.1 50S ribosomal protein L23 [Candidatus Omnitrophota bacterium]